jgi:hypothetical protein
MSRCLRASDLVRRVPRHVEYLAVVDSPLPKPVKGFGRGLNAVIPRPVSKFLR